MSDDSIARTKAKRKQKTNNIRCMARNRERSAERHIYFIRKATHVQRSKMYKKNISLGGFSVASAQSDCNTHKHNLHNRYRSSGSIECTKELLKRTATIDH